MLTQHQLLVANVITSAGSQDFSTGLGSLGHPSAALISSTIGH